MIWAVIALGCFASFAPLLGYWFGLRRGEASAPPFLLVDNERDKINTMIQDSAVALAQAHATSAARDATEKAKAAADEAIARGGLSHYIRAKTGGDKPSGGN